MGTARVGIPGSRFPLQRLSLQRDREGCSRGTAAQPSRTPAALRRAGLPPDPELASGRLLRGQLAQHVLQQAAVAEVVDFLRRKQHHVGLERILARSEEHTSELHTPMCISYDVFCLKKQNPELHT